MCNLYQMTPKNDLATYLAARVDVNWRDAPTADEPAASQRPVGPFGTGLFLRPQADGEGEGVGDDGDAPGALQAQWGQWGLIRPGQRERIDLMAPRPTGRGKPPAPRPRSTNNARIEGIADKPTFRDAWRQGRRCLIPAQWYAEPNWETGQNVWWHQRRRDGEPWFLAGLWSLWTDPHTGEQVPNYTMITCNCDGHPLLGRLHKPDPTLPDDAQDKRSLVHVPLQRWQQWLLGDEHEARSLLHPPEVDAFDLSDALAMDARLAALREQARAREAAALAPPAQGDLF